jgi:predicted enzyme related to lactoylglutathione lyase
VSFSVGLRSVGSFTTSFTRTYGMSPCERREENDMINISHAQLWVHDQDEALAFYTPKLGMEVKGLMAKGFAGTVFLSTDDVQADYEELTARGVEFTEPPEERPYGIDSGFRDPSGNSFRLTQVSEVFTS